MQEKRHFKLFARRYSGKTGNYIKLFDAIAGQEVYSDERTRWKLRNEPAGKHLAFEKHRLYQLINKALRLYHAGRSIDLQLKEMLIDAEILHEKSLYPHCKDTLQKARKMAHLYERYAFIPEIARLESRLFDLRRLDTVYEEEEEALKKMQVINSYRKLSNKVARWVAASHQVRRKADLSAFDRLMKGRLMQNENRATSFTASVYFFYIQAVYYELKGDLKSAYLSRRRFVERIEKNPEQMEVHLKNYLSALNNQAISQLELHLFDEAQQSIQKIIEIPASGAGAGDVEISRFVFSNILTLNLAIRTGNFERAYSRIPTIEKGLQKYGPAIQPQFKIVMQNSVKYVCFGANDLRGALRWSHQVMNEASPEVRQDIQAMSGIFNLVLHFEMGNTELFEYILKSTYRFLLKSERLYKVETIVLNYLRRSAHLHTQKEILGSFRQLYDELTPLARNRYEKKVFEEFDLLAWLEAKIGGKTFAQVVKEKAEKTAAAGAFTGKQPKISLKNK